MQSNIESGLVEKLVDIFMVFIMYRTLLKKSSSASSTRFSTAVLHSEPASSIKTSPDSAPKKSFDTPAVVRGGKAPPGAGCIKSVNTMN